LGALTVRQPCEGGWQMFLEIRAFLARHINEPATIGQSIWVPHFLKAVMSERPGKSAVAGKN